MTKAAELVEPLSRGKKGTRCQAYVSHRQYSVAGRCENTKSTSRMRIDLIVAVLCPAHRAMISRGQQVSLKLA